MTTCNMIGVSHSDELTGNYHPNLVSLRSTQCFSISQFIILVLLLQFTLTALIRAEYRAKNALKTHCMLPAQH